MSNLATKSVMNIVSALIGGETDPTKLEKLVYGNTANKRSGKLNEALTGNIKDYHRIQLKWEKDEYDLFDAQTEDCLTHMVRICNEQYSEEMSLLCTIPGVSMISAMAIIAETGADMSIFETSGKLTGWAGLRPRNDESAGKYKSTAIIKGNKYLKNKLVQVAWAASRTKGSFLKETFTRLSIRKSRKKALIAVARKILVVVWHLITEKIAYNPALLPVYDPAKLSKKIKYHQKEAERIEKLLEK
jgi:transposase